MPTTVPDAIVSPDGSYTGGFRAAMAAMATSIQAAFSKRRANSYRWVDAGERTAQTGMRVDDTGYQEDTDTSYRYDGAQWVTTAVAGVPAGIGLVRIVPTSISGTGATLSAGGKITLVACSADVQINGVLDDYDHVVMIVDVETTITAIAKFQLSAAGAAAATAYDQNRIGEAGASTVVGSQALNGTSWQFTIGGNGVAHRIVGEVHLLEAKNPAKGTQGYSTVIGTPNPMTTAINATIGTNGLLHRTLAAYDGVKFLVEGGSWSGKIRFYGYNDND